MRRNRPPSGGTGYCVDALEAAIWAVAGAGDHREAVLRAANLGDDADTTAAIAGQLAGARWGASGIPPAWREVVVAGPRIESLARHLHAAARGEAPVVWAADEFHHAWWVEPGRLLAGEYPGHPDPTEARVRVDLLVDAGIRTFVDLTGPADGLAPYAEVVDAVAASRDLDVRHERFPIPDFSVVDDPEYDVVAALVAGGLERGGVYVHCWGGVGRTGTVVGCLLADRGLGYDEALAELAALRAGTRKGGRAAPETEEQRAVIRRRAERRR